MIRRASVPDPRRHPRVVLDGSDRGPRGAMRPSRPAPEILAVTMPLPDPWRARRVGRVSGWVVTDD